MAQKKFRDFSVVFFGGLFLLTWEPVFIWLLVGGMVLLTPYSGRNRMTEKNRMFQIGKDAKKFGLNLPQSSALRSLFVKVYNNFYDSVEKYPHLEEEFKDVMNEMWSSLAANDSKDHWYDVLGSVLANWPHPEGRRSGENLQEKLKKVKELSQQWDEAKREAAGGSHV